MTLSISFEMVQLFLSLVYFISLSVEEPSLTDKAFSEYFLDPFRQSAIFPKSPQLGFFAVPNHHIHDSVVKHIIKVNDFLALCFCFFCDF